MNLLGLLISIILTWTSLQEWRSLKLSDCKCSLVTRKPYDAKKYKCIEDHLYDIKSTNTEDQTYGDCNFDLSLDTIASNVYGCTHNPGCAYVVTTTIKLIIIFTLSFTLDLTKRTIVHAALNAFSYDGNTLVMKSNFNTAILLMVVALIYLLGVDLHNGGGLFGPIKKTKNYYYNVRDEKGKFT